MYCLTYPFHTEFQWSTLPSANIPLRTKLKVRNDVSERVSVGRQRNLVRHTHDYLPFRFSVKPWTLTVNNKYILIHVATTSRANTDQQREIDTYKHTDTQTPRVMYTQTQRDTMSERHADNHSLSLSLILCTTTPWIKKDVSHWRHVRV